ncbi:MAG: DJ-1/PfpI family protein [Clostridiales Family XIII bacterium]|nr:DJ-1/PfpI family protein [Clostridiales Family XIII bacterium]
MVYLHLTDGFEEVEALTVLDLLRRAGISIQSTSMIKDLTVTGSHGIPVVADTLFEDVSYEHCEMMVLPGGPGVEKLGAHEAFNEALRKFADTGKWIAAICAAPKILAQNGLLSGKKATIYRGMEKELGNASHRDEKVVQDGNIITSMGPGTSIQFALKLIEVLSGEAEATKVREAILFD